MVWPDYMGNHLIPLRHLSSRSAAEPTYEVTSVARRTGKFLASSGLRVR